MDICELKNQIILEIEEAFEKAFGKKPGEGNIRLEFPPNVALGDFAISFFECAKELKLAPGEMAKKVAENMFADEIIDSLAVAGPYLNIKVKKGVLFETILGEVEKEGENFGNSKIGEGQKIMVEYLSPNTNKPLHLGHVRNGALGMAVANILATNGYEVIKGILINNRGVHICKSMLAWQKFGEGETPESSGIKGDHFVGKWYVRYALEVEKDPKMKEEVQEMLQKWEAGDRKTLDIWKMMNEWAYAGYQETWKNFGLEFDDFSYESETYKLGKDIVEEGLKKKIFYKNEKGAVIFDLSEAEFGLDQDGAKKKMTVVRADGTSVYLTQDLGTANMRAKKFDLDRMVYVVGSEQDFYFKVLFRVLFELGYSWAKNLYHLSYGMVILPEGKMKSREGKVVDADNLITEVENLVKAEIGKKDEEISDDEILRRARLIAIGAIKFQMLRVKPSQGIKFDPKESIAVDGFTGPYCQYAYARISGVLNKVKEQDLFLENRVDFSLLGSPEGLELAQKIMAFPEELKKSAEELNPLKTLSATYEISKVANLFYEKNRIIGEENELLAATRLNILSAARQVIKKGLNILGIKALDRM
jgi:arginyl-tRNA synthetase